MGRWIPEDDHSSISFEDTLSNLSWLHLHRRRSEPIAASIFSLLLVALRLAHQVGLSLPSIGSAARVTAWDCTTSGLSWTLECYYHHPQLRDKSLRVVLILPYQVPDPLYPARRTVDHPLPCLLCQEFRESCLSSAPVRRYGRSIKPSGHSRAKLTDRFWIFFFKW